MRREWPLPLVVESEEQTKCDKYCHLGVNLVNKSDFGNNRYGYGIICAPLSITTKATAAGLRFRRRWLCLYSLIAAV